MNYFNPMSWANSAIQLINNGYSYFNAESVSPPTEESAQILRIFPNKILRQIFAHCPSFSDQGQFACVSKKWSELQSQNLNSIKIMFEKMAPYLTVKEYGLVDRTFMPNLYSFGFRKVGQSFDFIVKNESDFNREIPGDYKFVFMCESVDQLLYKPPVVVQTHVPIKFINISRQDTIQMPKCNEFQLEKLAEHVQKKLTYRKKYYESKNPSLNLKDLLYLEEETCAELKANMKLK